jgi:hypothetical protein
LENVLIENRRNASGVGPGEVLEIQRDMLKKAMFLGLKSAFLAVKMGL